MATRVSLVSGPWSTASNWGTATSTPVATSTATNVTTLSGTYADSSNFTGVTADCLGAIIMIARKGTETSAGEITLALREGSTERATVTIPYAQITNYTNSYATLPTSTYVTYMFFKFSSGYTMTAGNTYKISVKTGGTWATFPQVHRDNASTVYAIPVDSRSSAAPVATEPVYITGYNGTNAITITVDGSVACGNSSSTAAVVHRASTNDFTACEGGVLTFDTTQSSTVTIDGNWIFSPGSTLNIGSSSVCYPDSYLARWITNQVGTGDHGGMFCLGSTSNVYGSPRTTPFAKYVSGNGTSGSKLVVDRDTDWVVGDTLFLTATSDNTYNWIEVDEATISAKTDARTFTLSFPDWFEKTNGGFETLGAGGLDVFANWTESAGSGTIVAENTLVHSGSYACKMNYVTGASTIYQTFYMSPGQTYTLSYWTRGDGTKEGRIRIYDNTNAVDIVATKGTGVTGTSYTLCTETFTVPATCISVRVYLLSPSTSGSAYFDDLTLIAGALNARDTNAYVVNTKRNISFEGASSALQSYMYFDGVGTQTCKWASFKYMATPTSGKYGTYLGSISSKQYMANFDYNTFVDGNYFGLYMLATKVTQTITGLVFYNTVTSSLTNTSSYGYYITATANKTFNNWFMMNLGRAPYMGQSANLTFNNPIFNSNSSASGGYGNVYMPAGYKIIYNNAEVNCGRGNGILIGSANEIIFKNAQVGTYGVNGSADIYPSDDSGATIVFDTCYFGSVSFIENYGNMLSTGKLSFQTLNGTANNHIWYTNRGIARSTGASLVDTTVRTSGGLAVRMAPESTATDYFDWEFSIPTGNIQNKDMMIGIWCYINSANYWAGTNTLPRLCVTYDNGTESYSQAAQVAGSWQFMLVPFTPTTTYPEVTVSIMTATDATSTDGYVYFDDMSVLYPAGYIMNLGNLDTWAKGQPLQPAISTLFSAQDVWAVAPSSMGTGTIGSFIKGLLTVAKFLALK